MKYKSISLTVAKELKLGDIVTVLADPISNAPDYTRLLSAADCTIENVVETKWICLTKILELNGVICIPQIKMNPKFILYPLSDMIENYDLDPLLERKISFLPKKITNLAFNINYAKWVSVSTIIEVESFKDGEYCCECGNFFPMAVPNLTNEKMACWTCRTSNSWKYSKLYIG